MAYTTTGGRAPQTRNSNNNNRSSARSGGGNYRSGGGYSTSSGNSNSNSGRSSNRSSNGGGFNRNNNNSTDSRGNYRSRSASNGGGSNGRPYSGGRGGNNSNSQSRSYGGNRGGYRGNSNGGGNRGGYRGGNNRFGGGNRGGRGRFTRGKPINPALYVNDLQQEDIAEAKAFEGMKYSDLNLVEKLDANIKRKGFETTTEIQQRAIPMILEGKDVLGISATGSGKTAAFLIPMIQKMLGDKSQYLLVVAPTRELAQQISDEAKSLVNGTNLETALIIGGESMGKQIAQLRRGGDIIIGTPGRLNDLINRNIITPSNYNNIVIDEVDRMLDMGFVQDIKFIFDSLGQPKQALLFSATLSKPIQKIVDSMISSYELIRLAENKPSKSVVQSIVNYNQNQNKIDLLEDLLKQDEVQKAIIFVDTKRFADKVDMTLYKRNFKVGVIHGDKRQNTRKNVIDSFKRSKINVLVATNVAARGIDIDDITHVINLDEPQTFDEYIHRIGRTGRNGALGTAYTFVMNRR
jgi:ATP-dependent RNA helicase RhlE